LLPPDIQTPSSCRTKEKEHNVKKLSGINWWSKFEKIEGRWWVA
jgi:hypothetical protein